MGVKTVKKYRKTWFLLLIINFDRIFMKTLIDSSPETISV